MTVEFTEAVWLEDRGKLTLVELGALAPLDARARDLSFAPTCIAAARTACRLRHDFELDSAGLALVLTLIERVHELEVDLQRLRARLPRAYP